MLMCSNQEGHVLLDPGSQVVAARLSDESESECDECAMRPQGASVVTVEVEKVVMVTQTQFMPDKLPVW